MRWLLFTVGALFSVSTTPAAVGGFELLGTVHAGGRPKAHAVVWLDVANGAGLRPLHQTKRVVLDQRTSTFFPRVLAVQVGTTVDLPNNDRVFHNVFSFHDGKKFDLGLYPVGTVKQVTFDHPGLSRIFCNIHPNMAAYVMAVETPYFSVSDEEGRFTITSLPPGAYTYHAWRSGGTDLTGSAVLDAGTPLDVRWP
jgi:plastocyanin